MNRIVVITKTPAMHQQLVFLVRSTIGKAAQQMGVDIAFMHLPIKKDLMTLAQNNGDSIFLVIPEDVHCGGHQVAEMLRSMNGRVVAAYVHTSAYGSLEGVPETFTLYSHQIPEAFKDALKTFVGQDEQPASRIVSEIPSSPHLAAVG